MARQILLIRHARVAPPWAGRYVGWSDAPLADFPVAQQEGLVRLLRQRQTTRLRVSPLRRAVDTAAPLARALALEPLADPDLKEAHFGAWEGLTFAEIQQAWPEDVRRWAEFAPDFAFPGGEATAGFFARVRRAAERLAAEPEETVAAVTHAGVIRALICHWLDLAPRHYLAFEIRHAACATIKLCDGHGMLAGLNETEAAPS